MDSPNNINQEYNKPKSKNIIFWTGLIILIGASMIITLVIIKTGKNNIKSSDTVLNSKAVALNVIGNSNLLPPSLGLEKLNSEVQVGDELDVGIVLTSASQLVDGVDIVLLYDPAYFIYLPESAIAEGNLPVLLGEDFQNEGVVKFSLLSNPGGQFIGEQQLVASLSFRARKSGVSELRLLDNQGTEDTNISSQGIDILKSAGQLQVEIK